jgi:hypothetical protein
MSCVDLNTVRTATNHKQHSAKKHLFSTKYSWLTELSQGTLGAGFVLFPIFIDCLDFPWGNLRCSMERGYVYELLTQVSESSYHSRYGT